MRTECIHACPLLVCEGWKSKQLNIRGDNIFYSSYTFSLWTPKKNVFLFRKTPGRTRSVTSLWGKQGSVHLENTLVNDVIPLIFLAIQYNISSEPRESSASGLLMIKYSNSMHFSFRFGWGKMRLTSITRIMCKITPCLGIKRTHRKQIRT